MKKHYEIVVIGGGVMGGSLAYRFAKAGKDVVLFEKKEICSGTSRSTAAMALPTTKDTEAFAKLAWDSYAIYNNTLVKELDPFELQETGSMDLYFDEAGREKLAKKAALHTKLGHPSVMMEREEAMATEPSFRYTKALGGCYCPEGGQVNPFLLTRAYVEGAKKLGAEVYTYTKVTDLTVEDGRVTVVHTTAGDVEDPALVLCCAGEDCIEFGEMLGIPHHVKLNRGYNLISEKLPPIMKAITAWTQQTPSGNLNIGAVHDPVYAGDPHDRSMEEYGMTLSAQGFLKNFPGLKDINIIRTFTGIRVMTDDGWPVIGPNPKVKNFWIHAGHSSFLLNPILAEYALGLYEGTITPKDIPLVSYERFENQKGANA